MAKLKKSHQGSLDGKAYSFFLIQIIQNFLDASLEKVAHLE
jgi:hypothetical protein